MAFVVSIKRGESLNAKLHDDNESYIKHLIRAGWPFRPLRTLPRPHAKRRPRYCYNYFLFTTFIIYIFSFLKYCDRILDDAFICLIRPCYFICYCYKFIGMMK